MDLQIAAGRVNALVSGSSLYKVAIQMKPLAKPRWAGIKSRCAGQIGSLIELLRGSISKGVMEIVTRKGEGLFPSPKEISLSCSCPDWATMCKHVAATLYGVGARLDHAPELLFTLRRVDPTEMVEAAVDQPPPAGARRRGRVLASQDLSSVFGVDIDLGDPATREPAAPANQRPRRSRGKPAPRAPRSAAKTEPKPKAAAPKRRLAATDTRAKRPALSKKKAAKKK